MCVLYEDPPLLPGPATCSRARRVLAARRAGSVRAAACVVDAHQTTQTTQTPPAPFARALIANRAARAAAVTYLVLLHAAVFGLLVTVLADVN